MSFMKSTMASSEPDVAFPAVLKGSKQRVPPPVPPRGSPKAKRGGGNSQSSTLDNKGDYALNISVNDIPPQTPITSSDDDFCFYGHDFKFKEPAACRIAPSVSEHSVKLTKLVASNSFLDFADEGESITQRCHPDKDLIAQTNMMAKFKIDKLVLEHLDSGEYDDTSLTESSSEERIVFEVNEVVDEVRVKQTKSPSQFIKGVVTQIGEKINKKSAVEVKKSNADVISSDERVSVHNVRSSDLIFAAKTLKKTSKTDDNNDFLETKNIHNKNGPKPGIISGITKKLNFNQPKRDRSRVQEIRGEKTKPKVEIRTYIEGKSKGGMTKDEVICHKKAKTKIDMFQKHIWKVQSDSEDSSRRSSVSSSQDSKKSDKTYDIIKHKATKKIFEPIEYTHESIHSIDRKLFCLKTTAVNPIVSKTIIGNVHEKIKKFSEGTDSDTKEPVRVPRQKKKGSFRKRSEKRKIFKMWKDVEEVL
ncbi:Uncharacterized protein OBRU01_01760 [Operophtera brumata]|uniref:Uncharacterized protein n=1 Tax=Operophtera brumata TaxID=104452 RepID=A0A0L7LTJ5_OPEBR|nr:Uncharacterized protein OBRU01_01760 [Operophtera brumata]